MTTQHHEGAVEVSDDAWIRGGSEQRSYVSPWYVVTIKHRDLDREQGELADGVVTEAVDGLHAYTSPSH
jgi:hypothetical protein